MTRADQYAELRRAGYTYEKIAEICGCSYQNVAQHLARKNEVIFRGVVKEQVVFDGLRKWMNDNKVSVRELFRQLNGKNPGGVSSGCFSDRLTGKTQFRMNEINKIISVTGLTYEQLFMAKEGKDG